MSKRLIFRGRILFLILASLIVLERGSGVVFALTGPHDKLNLWKSVIMPLGMIYFVISLWQGEPLIRWLVAIWSILTGGPLLILFGVSFYQLAMMTPREQAGMILNLFGPLLSIPLLYGGCYVVAGLMLICSRSLNAFFDYQYGMAASPWIALSDWLSGCFQKADSVERMRRDMLRRRANRTELPRALLESLDDFELVTAIIDYVMNKTAGKSSRLTEFEILSSLPRGFQAVYGTWQLKAEVENGGFHQYFYNNSVDEAFMALEGYKLFGETELTVLLARAIDIYLQEEPEQLSHRTDNPLELIEGYVKARAVSTLPELDTQFYQTNGEKQMVEYIRGHLDEFVTR